MIGMLVCSKFTHPEVREVRNDLTTWTFQVYQ